MKLKSYYSRSVEDAIAAARQELGPDAMLVNSRRALPEAKHLGDYEVVFVTDAPARLDNEKPALAAGDPVAQRLTAEVSDLKRELEAMRRALTRSAYAPHETRGDSADSAQAYGALTAADVYPELARAIVDAAEERAGAAGAPGADAFGRALVQELHARISTDPALGRGDGGPRIVALVGPPGSGKTTTLVKFAVNYGLASRRPAVLLSVDTYRVAAAEQLRSYAAILGLGFQVLETVAALAQSLEEHRNKELIFIDTPGFGFHDLDTAADLARFLATRQDIDTQLVLPCSMKAADLSRVAEAFAVFRPGRLLFTKIDETGSFGPIVNESVRAGKPVSFLANGQRIPEDLETASPQRIVGLVMAGRSCEMRAAA
jgi:flagellar biosynthesis protein FlhF